MMQNNSQITSRLASESIGALLLRYSIPAIISMAAMSIYNVIDSIYIGHGVGPLAISAMAVNFPFMNLVFAFSLLVGIGGAAYTSIYIGSKNMELAFKVLGNVFWLNLISSTIISILLITFMEPLLYLFGASAETDPYAIDFMSIFLLGTPISMTMFNLNHIMRASGYPIKAMCSVLLSVLLNAIFGYIFIFIFKWGMKGAAFATLLAQAGALVWVLSHLVQKSSLIHFRKDIFRLDKKIIKNILSIGISPFFVYVCACLVTVLINQSLASFQGDLGIGAFGIMNRLMFIFVMVVVGISQGMQPIVGFNYGAGRIDRAKKTLVYAIVVSSIVTTSGFLLAEFFPHAVVALFTDDGELTDLAVNGLQIGALMFPFVGAQIIIQQYFQYIGKPKIAIILSVSRQMAILVPFLIILPHFYGYNGIWASIPVSDVLSSVLAIVLLYISQKKENTVVPQLSQK